MRPNRLQGLASDGLVGAGGGALARRGAHGRGGAQGRQGARPVSSTAAFRASLLGAESIAYGDPAKGATTGIHFGKMLEKLGIQDAVRGKSQLAANGLDVMKLVADGKAEIGVTQISEILHVKGDTLVGPLPAGTAAGVELQRRAWQRNAKAGRRAVCRPAGQRRRPRPLPPRRVRLTATPGGVPWPGRRLLIHWRLP